MGKQRFSKQRTVRSLRLAGKMLAGYPGFVAMMWSPVKERSFLFRTLILAPLFFLKLLIGTVLFLYDVLDQAMDPVRCLIHGVPPPPTPEEMAWMMNQAQHRLETFTRAAEAVRRAQRR